MEVARSELEIGRATIDRQREKSDELNRHIMELEKSKHGLEMKVEEAGRKVTDSEARAREIAQKLNSMD